MPHDVITSAIYRQCALDNPTVMYPVSVGVRITLGCFDTLRKVEGRSTHCYVSL